MAYFDISVEQYGGWDAGQKAEALKNAELSPDRECENGENDE